MLDIIIRFLEAAALGAMVGLEREVLATSQEKLKKSISVFWGLRSYTLIALLGAGAAYLGDIMGGIESMIYFVGGIVFTFIIISYIYSSFRRDQFGVTSEFAALMTFMVGVLAMVGEIQIAVFLGITVTLMLASKSRLTPLIDKIGKDEVTNTLKFAVIALVILPLLPDVKYSLSDLLVFLPHNAFTDISFLNPYSIWLFVVVMSAVSYIGYILTRLFGASKGIIVSGAIGGMVSSTAVTSAMAEKSKSSKTFIKPAVIATVTACTIMLLRIIGIVSFVNPYLLGTLLWPLVAMLVVSGIIIWRMALKTDTHKWVATGDHRSPFEIMPALKFAGFIVLIKFFSTVAVHFFGESATWVVALFSGLADVDAITQDMADRSLVTTVNHISTITASVGIIVALVTNTLVKMALARKFGDPVFGKKVNQALWVVLIIGMISVSIVSIFS